MIYRLNRNRALQVGIRAMSVLSGPKLSELPVVFEWYVELPSILVVLFIVVLTCCLVLLIRGEMSGGNGRNDDVCFSYSRVQRRCTCCLCFSKRHKIVFFNFFLLYVLSSKIEENL